MCGSVFASIRFGLVAAGALFIAGVWSDKAAARGGPIGPPMYTLTELSHIDLGTSSSIPYAISDSTASGPIVVGESFHGFAMPQLSWRAVMWRPNVSLTPTDLLTVAQAGNSSVNRAQDVSPNGQYIVGYSNVGTPHGKRWTINPATGAITSVQTPSTALDRSLANSAGSRAANPSRPAECSCSRRCSRRMQPTSTATAR